MKRGKRADKRADRPDVVAVVQQQTAQAAALAEISGQHLLSDPALNPATRGRADELRRDELVKALNARHSRALRSHRVADARAEEAERTLEALALARRASHPARSVLALHNGRRLYARLSTAASVVLAAGSAMGVEAAAKSLGAPAGSGYIAEVGLTGLATAAITYRAHLAEHGGKLVEKSWQARTLWALMVVPLLISVGCNLAKTNVVGAACAIGAAAFALLACVVADRSAEAMQARAGEVDAADERELRTVAMGAEPVALVRDPVIAESRDHGTIRAEDELLPAAPMALEGRVADPVIAESRDSGTGDDLDEGQDEDDFGPIWDWPPGQGHIDGRPGNGAGHIDRDQDDDDPGDGFEGGPDEGLRRVQAAAEARRAAGDRTRQRVHSYLSRHPDATVPQITGALEISEATAKRHRRALRNANGVEL